MADVSNAQMVLAGSPLFLGRIQYLLATQARVVLTETGIGTTHAARAAYAKSVIPNVASCAIPAAVLVVGGINLTSVAITGSGMTADSAATDAAILSQIATFWNQLAGIDTGN